MKKALPILLALILCASLNAQIKFSAGATLGLPMGGFADQVSTGFGAFAQGEMKVSGYQSYAQVGYLAFGGKEIGNVKTSWGVIPVTVGVKYPFTPVIYGTIGVGMNFASLTIDRSTYSLMGMTVPGGTTTVSESKFGWLIGGGYKLDKIDIQLKYQNLGWTDSNFLGANVIYAF